MRTDSPVVLRRATAADAPAVADVYLRSFAAALPTVGRGRGIGDRFVSLARQRSPRGLTLWTFQVNEPAHRFYERHGFTAVEFTDGSGNEEREPDVRYEWRP
ncbi:GNAT family N-acetyltransferase [Streptomyces lasalocidi]|uniref:GNAT family N-acetyltransferase n=1 Tax=Streptomyces lasalocidi TaxID=324833 RepID=A0A4U5WEN3_STRLS|nr:GNAT family N-acetyltransferase [Streptomyces lasalocidi]TKT00249.1 GNAT family N-acetyltransferase [Streptomyces lasalocidi]